MLQSFNMRAADKLTEIPAKTATAASSPSSLSSSSSSLTVAEQQTPLLCNIKGCRSYNNTNTNFVTTTSKKLNHQHQLYCHQFHQNIFKETKPTLVAVAAAGTANCTIIPTIVGKSLKVHPYLRPPATPSTALSDKLKQNVSVAASATATATSGLLLNYANSVGKTVNSSGSGGRAEAPPPPPPPLPLPLSLSTDSSGLHLSFRTSNMADGSMSALPLPSPSIIKDIEIKTEVDIDMATKTNNNNGLLWSNNTGELLSNASAKSNLSPSVDCNQTVAADGDGSGGGGGCNGNSNNGLVLPMTTTMSATMTTAAATTTIDLDDEYSKDQPDPDNIKMFVGQIPKSMNEIQLKNMFEQYGRVHTVNVLRDKITLMSRGCCFVTYYTRKAALTAQGALHNIKTLSGMHHPIQMKPADSENRNERKLFVGMINKKYNESDVRQLFNGHGTIEECTVLRDQNGQSKGCAFVTFSTKQAALGAIKAVHQSQTMEGCSAPIVVKFADTQKEKDQKKMQQLQASICSITSMGSGGGGGVVGGGPTIGAVVAPTNGLSPAVIQQQHQQPPVSGRTTNPSSVAAALAAAAAAAAGVSAPTPTAAATAGLVPTSASALAATPSMLAAAAAAAANPSQQASPYLTSAAAAAAAADAISASATQMQLFQQLQTFGLHPAQYLQGLNFPPDHHSATNLTAVSGGGGLIAAPISMQNLVTLATLNHHHHHPHSAAAAAAVHHHQMAHYQAAQAHHHPQSVPAQPMPAQLTNATAATLWPGTDGLTTQYATTLSPLTNGAYTASPLTASALQAAAVSVAGKQIEGPEGSNLFIYHLPQEFTDTDLASTFLPFGNVLSAKVFIDKQTNLSKCFGFVSYDNPHSANAAIQAMHGFQIGTKRLKVQLKRSKDAAKPY